MLITALRLLKAIGTGFKEDEFRAIFLFVAMLLLSGTVTFNQLENWDWLDSLYHSVAILTTVGDSLMPETTAGKVFSMFYILIGLGVMATLIAQLALHIKSQYSKPKNQK